ncbi:hypothetical protein [Motiliproteus sp. MSK22-1]|uniref:hypothetical protein n=1 Tax=Motiliproteus sp. MSK22-1 TaxID=1897630 RepID=UPI000976B649|nr:hypothetical protein [Motiliproteus sp. MSK22-1]OMH33757.1 hypothetical protein BGP75_12235 [Motiliproteus sp. MSK22-1]
MLTYEDCLEMCDLTLDEIDAVAEHEHLQRIQAIATAEYLVKAEGGERKLRRMIIEDIRHAQKISDHHREQDLKRVLTLFIKTHPRHALSNRG